MANTSKILVARVSAAIMRGFAVARDLASWLFATALHFKTAPARHDVRKAYEPRRLSLAEQWNHLSDIVMGAASRAEEATRCHASATLQLDLAQYALTSLVDELSAVMDMGPRRRRATVHVLGVAPFPALRPIGNAIAA